MIEIAFLYSQTFKFLEEVLNTSNCADIYVTPASFFLQSLPTKANRFVAISLSPSPMNRGRARNQVYVPKGRSSPSSAGAYAQPHRPVGNYGSSEDLPSGGKIGSYYEWRKNRGMSAGVVAQQSDYVATSEVSSVPFTPARSFTDSLSRVHDLRLEDASPTTTDCSSRQLQTRFLDSNDKMDNADKHSSVMRLSREQTEDISEKIHKRSESPEPDNLATRDGQASHQKMDRVGKVETSQNQDHGVPFDICPVKAANVIQLKVPLHLKNREKRNEIKRINEAKSINVLRPGMVHLRHYLSLAEQVKIIETCRKFGLGFGGFFQPVYPGGGKLNLKMMCLGKIWDHESGRYCDERPSDGAKPFTIPSEFREWVMRAIKDSHDYLRKQSKWENVEDILPSLSPDICVVNFYTMSGRLGLHQDKHESAESLRRGLPVVSFSVGDSAEFLYGEQRDIDKAEKVVLESGDVLIFGGKSRLIFHGVTTIHAETAPKYLLEETNLRPGRLNLTFRQY